MRRALARFAAAILGVVLTAGAAAGARRVLYVTATAGFRHAESIDASVETMRELAAESGVLEIVHTEDLALISADSLRAFDAVYFFTSGELPLTDSQKAALLDFVRSGKGFGGSHSATDTLYTWSDYGEMIGAYFDGHPWAQEAAVDVEDPQNPIVAHMAPGFRTVEEFYQFRNLSRDRVRVLLTLDTRTVDLAAPGVNRTDGDFPLAWIQRFGNGRVFYSAFGHFQDGFRQPALRTMLMKALLWLTGEIEVDATPRSGPGAPAPSIPPGGVRNLMGDADAFAPGALVTISGERLTSGSTLGAVSTPLPVRLAGTRVEVNGIAAPLFSVEPNQVIAQLPAGLAPGENVALTVFSVNRASEPAPLRIDPAVPVILAANRTGNVLTLYMSGLGATDPAIVEGVAAPASPLARTLLVPAVRIGGRPATVEFSGLAPLLAGVYVVNAAIPAGASANGSGKLEVLVEAGARQSNMLLIDP